jgi:hypothetical protein
MLVLVFYVALCTLLFILCYAIARCCTWVFSPIMQTPMAYHLRPSPTRKDAPQ